MNDYIELRIDSTPSSEEINDLVAAFLADIGYESFVPDDKGLTAFVKSDIFDNEQVSEILNSFPIETSFSCSHRLIEGQDWNEEWEKNYFKPIVIGDRCVVHSTFHTDVPAAEYAIIIDPKMAFGTGHHSTTNLMVSYLLDMDLNGFRIIDVGTGTAILAILAAKRGAADVVGIEIDPGAWENAVENVKLNNVVAEMLCGDASRLGSLEPADMVIANINRNIITSDIDKYSKALKQGGTMLLSGFYSEDVEIIRNSAEPYNLRVEEIREDNNWVAVKLVKI